MDTPRLPLAALLRRLRLRVGARGVRRLWLASASAALCVFVLTGTLLAFHLQDTPSPSTADPTAIVGIATATAATTATTTARTATPHAKTAHTQITPPAMHLAAPPPPPPPVPTAPPLPTPTPCPSPTPLPAPTATATPTTVPTALPTATPSASPSAAATNGAPHFAAQVSATCQQCPYYKGGNPTQSQIQSALFAAADQYHLPHNLLQAVAWQESKWHEDVVSCDGGIGLMQVQYYTWPWLNGLSIAQCNLVPTSYDPNTLQGNADLGAKYLQYLSCFYSYLGDDGGTSPSNPSRFTSAWYYQNANLSYPDSNAPHSLCAGVFNDPNNPEYAALPSTTAQPWSCPFSATAGDNTLLNIVLSAYNEGPGAVSTCGICNPGYVQNVEAYIPQFAAASLP